MTDGDVWINKIQSDNEKLRLDNAILKRDMRLVLREITDLVNHVDSSHATRILWLVRLLKHR